MRRIPLASVIVLAGIVRAAEVAPSTPLPTPSSDGAIAIESVSQAVGSPATRAVTPGTAAKLAAAVPKFAPPANEPVAKAATDSPLLRAEEKPRNQIVRLPEFFVGEPKVHMPSRVQVLTPKGRVDLGFQRRPGLKYVPLAWMNAGVAVEMLEEDLRAQRLAEQAALLSLYVTR